MTSADVKAALRKRHPALGQGSFIGPWTCLEEFMEIDLLAISSWSSHHYRRVGYEVKISRSDYRRELLNPHKRWAAVSWCHEFYFAVPNGLLTDAEIAYTEREWEPGDFVRERCTAERCYRDRARRENGHSIYHEERTEEHPYGRTEWVRCETCQGTGYLTLSRVEREAPTLWVPRDVGLAVVTDRGVTIAKKPPRRPLKTDAQERRADMLLANIVRHTSARPDPRHAAMGGATA